MKRSRTDLSYMLTMQLTSPLYEFPFLKSYPVKNDININKNSDNSINVESVSGKEIEVRMYLFDFYFKTRSPLSK